ncbi:MAG: transposase [Candidatus Omnitrophica bacterium]|nr:transposase [Candidatus Omnitrophota bacterium]
MPRQARWLMDGGCYHILTRGNNRMTVFHDDVDLQRYGQLLATYLPENHLRLYHYCLMSNHVHLVVEAGRAAQLTKAMHGLNLSYALAYRKRHGHVGHFWQDRFKSLLISRDNYLLQCGAYVELNPVRAKMVKAPEAYAWSSYRVYGFGAPNPLVTLNPLYEQLGTTSSVRQARYRHFVLEHLGAPLPAWTARGAIGSPAFLKQLADQYDRPLLPQPRGRPRKVMASAASEK